MVVFLIYKGLRKSVSQSSIATDLDCRQAGAKKTLVRVRDQERSGIVKVASIIQRCGSKVEVGVAGLEIQKKGWRENVSVIKLGVVSDCDIIARGLSPSERRWPEHRLQLESTEGV